jgi:hypothetical protein
MDIKDMHRRSHRSVPLHPQSPFFTMLLQYTLISFFSSWKLHIYSIFHVTSDKGLLFAKNWKINLNIYEKIGTNYLARNRTEGRLIIE